MIRAQASLANQAGLDPCAAPLGYLDSRWYAACTRANHEKRVAEQLDRRTIECFLPVYESTRRWKDRSVRLQLPLFPGYVFVRIPLRDRLEVFTVRGVARLVGFNGTPAPIADDEVAGLRSALAQGLRAEPHPFLKVGRRVRISSGPLAGAEGILVRRNGARRVVLSIQLIQRSILVQIDYAELEPLD